MVIELKPNSRVVWEFNRTKVPPRIQGFHLLDGKDILEFTTEEVTLYKMKEVFNKQIFQARF